MVEVLASIAVLVSLAAQPDDAAVAAAKRAEARAFEAIDDERWCEAMHHFLEANGAAPSVDLIYNAAQAADLAEDRKQALKLYVELVGAYPGSERQAEVNARIRELTAILGDEGEGSPCPPPPEKGVEDAPAPTPAPVIEPVGEGPALGAFLPWAMVGGGAVVMAAGATLAGVGSVPYFSFLDARERILAAEAAGADAGALQRQQTEARESWQSWGELTTWSGVIAIVTGAAIATGGLVWALMGPTPDEQGSGSGSEHTNDTDDTDARAEPATDGAPSEG